ncbi:MAG: MogA/MoaB family molybdenum cofactor biosynthesis protein [Eggerthellaceae bacterium]|nr:MogA/MoaB family molybdenum cofactor biosynthesis protein [Eggerthellaceae bacterium]
MTEETPTPITFGIVTCSDSRDLSQDFAGDALEKLIAEQGWVCRTHTLVRDERPHIAQAIKHCADDLKVDVVLTCGGSGLSMRDVTPEATQDVCERNVPGIAEAMRAHSLQITPHAMLSRAVCMQRGTTLVINLPGSTKAATENWEAVVGVLPHAVKMTAGGGH